ncbi:zinc finger, CCHC-type containing protein [Tanacetum coccineum]
MDDASNLGANGNTKGSSSQPIVVKASTMDNSVSIKNSFDALMDNSYKANETNKQTLSEWAEDVESDDEVDEVLYPEGNKFEDQFDIRLKGVIIRLYVDDMLIFGTNQVQVDLTKEFLSSRFSMKDIGEVDVILVSTPMDTSEKLMPNNSQAVSQLEYSRVIGCLMYAMTYTRLILLLQWASKKKTCITSSTIEYELVALAAAVKEAEWLRNLIHEIPLWSNPIVPISIHCDSAATLAKDFT